MNCLRLCRLAAILSLVVLLAGLAVACGDDDDDDTDTTPTPSSAPATSAAPTDAPEPATLKIGINLELSGQYAVAIQPFLDGIEMAVEDINSNGGILADGKQYTIELVTKDNQLDPNVAVANTTELIRDDGIKYIFGPLSDLYVATHPVAAAEGVWTATQSIATQMDLTAKPISENPNVFISNSKYDDVFGLGAQALATLVPEAANGTVAIVNEDTPSGTLFTEVLKGAAATAGFQVVAEEKYAIQGADFNTIMTKVKSSSPDFIWASTVLNAIPLLKAAEELEVTDYYMTTVIDPQVPLAAAVGGPIAHPLYMINNAPSFGSLASSAERKAFGEEVTAAVGGPVMSAFEFVFTGGYYTMQLLATAMEEAGTVEDVAAVSEAMEGLSLDGPIGAGTVKGHFVTLPMEVVEFKGGAVAQVCYYASLDDPSDSECAVPEQ